MAEGEDRTQAASERRLLRAREEGQVPLSRELVVAVGLGAAALVLALGAPSMTRKVALQLRNMLLDLGATPEAALQHAEVAWFTGAGPMLLAVALAGCCAVLLQTGFLLNTAALMPDLGRVSPGRGLKKVFGFDNAIEAMKALAKLGILAWAVWSAMVDVLPQAHAALSWTPMVLMNRLGQDLVHLVLLVLAAQAGIALLDVGITRWRFAQRMKMSREDLRQEHRDSEGDPRIKARLRQLRQARSRRRMLAAVAKATVVITNPTHYAVALSYERGTQVAPRIVAKGSDEIAARIRAAAEKAGVPLVANPPLARALYTVALDAEVPAEHFRVVAEIIAYVWRLKGLAPTK